MREHDVGRTDEIPEGGSKAVTVENVPVAIFNVEGEFYAIHDRCVHKEGPIHEGSVNRENCSVHCPWHGMEFHLETGESPVTNHLKQPTFDIEARDGRLVLHL